MKKITVGVFLVNPENQVLLHLRDNKPTVFMSGMWTGLGGSIEDNETAEEAVFRELMEEISYRPKELYYLIGYLQPDRVVHIYFSFTDVASNSLILNEGVALQYYSFEEIEKLYEEGKTNKDIINQAKILKQEVLKKRIELGRL